MTLSASPPTLVAMAEVLDDLASGLLRLEDQSLLAMSKPSQTTANHLYLQDLDIMIQTVRGLADYVRWREAGGPSPEAFYRQMPLRSLAERLMPQFSDVHPPLSTPELF